jgi:hypothetical protein
MRGQIELADVRLTAYEILAGALFFSDIQHVTRQGILRFFHVLQEHVPDGYSRFRVRETARGFFSEPIGRIIDMLEIGQLLEPVSIDPMSSMQRVRVSMLVNVETELKGREVLPRHEHILRQLGKAFSDIHLTPTSTAE